MRIETGWTPPLEASLRRKQSDIKMIFTTPMQMRTANTGCKPCEEGGCAENRMAARAIRGPALLLLRVEGSIVQDGVRVEWGLVRELCAPFWPLIKGVCVCVCKRSSCSSLTYSY